MLRKERSMTTVCMLCVFFSSSPSHTLSPSIHLSYFIFRNETRKRKKKLLIVTWSSTPFAIYIFFFCLRINTRYNTNNIKLVPILLFDNMWRKTCSRRLEINSCQFWQHIIKHISQSQVTIYNLAMRNAQRNAH